ncbi:class I SAM-dependent methyltransferase [Sutterella sp.]|uniref:class I SAM-dependent methyltransferase n=1 Tax=Sutterella sp. TaxID=1981025 RepID=UPI0026DFFE06|nr:class I SAM-dependent methyltransferase [Sutterella sp.]MDO5532591.1 class I SAM-dependent methyltransferase [Sutterella sp.]
MTYPPVLDPCCGTKRFYFQPDSPAVLFGDIRQVDEFMCDGRALEVKPDVKLDFTQMPFPDSTFSLVIFDPPHFARAGEKSIMGKVYGRLPKKEPLTFLRKGFDECWRVLKPNGTLIFKWSEYSFGLKPVLEALGRTLLCGNHLPGKHGYWLVFFKEAA